MTHASDLRKHTFTNFLTNLFTVSYLFTVISHVELNSQVKQTCCMTHLCFSKGEKHLFDFKYNVLIRMNLGGVGGREGFMELRGFIG